MKMEEGLDALILQQRRNVYSYKDFMLCCNSNYIRHHPAPNKVTLLGASVTNQTF
jgi:hypothetical protein